MKRNRNKTNIKIKGKRPLIIFSSFININYFLNGKEIILQQKEGEEGQLGPKKKKKKIKNKK